MVFLATLYDAARAWQFLFQDEASHAMFALVNFHHDVMFYLVVVFIFVLDALFEILIECAHRKPSIFHSSATSQLFTDVIWERNLPRIYFRSRGRKDLKNKMFLFKRHTLYTMGLASSCFRATVFVNPCVQCEWTASFLTPTHRVLFLPSGLRFTHNTVLEVVWTIIPMCILLFIAGPSMSLLYSTDELITPAVTVKIIGHQWYWTYEVNDGFGLQTMRDHVYPIVRLFDAYMVPVEDLRLGELRLLETTECLFVPVDICIRFLITSADVLHSWAVPSLGIKVDACPGRLNHIMTRIFRPGVYYGQCSEICGVNHAFMPIKVEGVDLFTYRCYLLCQ